MLLQKGDVLEEELLLQILGPGRDHNTPPGKERRDQVGERLPCPGAGLDNEMLSVFESGLDSFGHLKLAGTKLEVGMPLGKGSVTREELARAGGASLGHFW